MLSLSTTSISTTLEYPASNLATLAGLKALLRVWASSRMWGRTTIACAPQGFLVALPDMVSTENPPLTICSVLSILISLLHALGGLGQADPFVQLFRSNKV